MSDITLIPTNTFSNSIFDVLQSDQIEDPLINMNKLYTMDLEESYFADTCRFIMEQNNAITEHKIALYSALSESANEVVILESFSDFFVKIKDIINKFIAFIKSLFKRFIDHLMHLVGSEKYIKKNKDKFKKFKDVDKFDFYCYEFTFSPNIPLTSTGLEYNTIFDDMYKGQQDNLSKDLISNVISAFNPDDDYDKFRATVIGKDTPISASDFGEELFKVFRNDELDTESREITSMEVRKSLARFLDYNNAKKSITKTQNEIEKSYNEIKKNIENLVNKNGNINVSAFINQFPSGTNGHNFTKFDGSNITPELGFNSASDFMSTFNIYTKNKVDQVTEYTNIHALAFSAKLDALKDCFNQDRNLLYKALYMIDRTDSKRKEA